MSLSVRAALAAIASLFVLGAGAVPGASLASGFVPAIATVTSLDTISSDDLADKAGPAPAPATLDARAETPALPQPATLAALVDRKADDETDSRDEECLASTVYYEAKSETLNGQLAVAEVVINRTTSGRFPASICSVVTQPSQFGFVRGGRFQVPPQTSAAWKTAVAIARIALDGAWQSTAASSLYFHAVRSRPGWANVTRVTQIGGHIFYR